MFNRSIITHSATSSFPVIAGVIVSETSPRKKPGNLGFMRQNNRSVLDAADLADDVDELSSLEGQLVRLVGLAVPQALVVVSVI